MFVYVKSLLGLQASGGLYPPRRDTHARKRKKVQTPDPHDLLTHYPFQSNTPPLTPTTMHTFGKKPKLCYYVLQVSIVSSF